MINNEEMLERIKSYIREYDCVFILNNIDCVIGNFICFISQQAEGKILLIMKKSVCNNIQEYTQRSSWHQVDIKMITDEEYSDIENLYCMYEFANCVHLLNRNTQYGSLTNYIVNGLLTEDEALLALYKGFHLLNC